MSSITGLTENENNQGKTMLLNQENTSDQQSRLGDNGTLQTEINSIQEFGKFKGPTFTPINLLYNDVIPE